MGSLTAAELEALLAGIPDLAQFGAQLLVPFEVRALPRARILWLNTRWFSQRGLPIACDASLRGRIESWALDQFALSTGDESENRGTERRTVHTDRYGDTRGTSPHGGSGRVATIGTFQVKGVGPTPLVGDATWIHSHGQMSLTEAICEAIFSELLDQELPFGAVPVIAVIDCGETWKTPQGDVQRALIVRPAAARPAHLLRAPSFVPSAGPVLAPSPDAVRVREAIAHLASMSAADRSRVHFPEDISEFSTRLARQAATADVLRMYTGGLFAGNVSLDGAVLDFGVARALYTWANVQVHAHARGFGREIDRLADVTKAIQYFARKADFADSPWFKPQVDGMKLRQVYGDEQQEMFGKMWSDESLDREAQQAVRGAMQTYFEGQQTISLRERWDGKRPGVNWIHDKLIRDSPPSGSEALDPEGRLALSIRDALQRRSHVLARHSWRSASRVLRPRFELDRTRLERRVVRVLRDAQVADRPDLVERLIQGVIGRCRRWWPAAPTGVAITSQRVRHGCSALECVSGDDQVPTWWIEGYLSAGRYAWGAAHLAESEVSSLRPMVENGRWHCLLGARGLPVTVARQLSPAPQLTYPAPPDWW